MGGRQLKASVAVIAAGLALAVTAAHGQSAAPTTGPITVPSFVLPYSTYNAPETVALFDRMRALPQLPPNASIPEMRAYYDVQNTDRVKRMRAMYDVKVTDITIGGVHVQRVLPSAGVAAANRGRVLVNLHGGAFMWGANSGALAEAIPIAAVGRIEVLTVDYRLGPENRFPAATEDVIAVYKALLGKYPARAIGIYGCSAGGGLTAQSVAWMIDKKIPVPGAIGTFCASLVDLGGDSAYFAAAATGQVPSPATMPKLISIPYFAGARADDPMVFPGLSPAIVKRFPPTLLISGTRDFALSSVLHSNELLRAAGVKTELRVWDGMPHAFFVDPEAAESKQAYQAIVDFFAANLVAK
ncbi:alpha/beta hydrolase fold domain-containing protein [Sphingomonas panacisoli]|nr:alpha/beta hydrolase fold domain-containing protein [Sphingomonas panacisoli]